MESLVDRIKRHEGYRSNTYIDSTGNATIGYGHKLEEPDDYQDGISKDYAEKLLMSDIDSVKRQVAAAFPWSMRLDDARLAVLTEMVFQLGVGGVQKFQKMISALREDDYGRAAREMLNSEWHNQTSKRCEELARIMQTGG